MDQDYGFIQSRPRLPSRHEQSSFSKDNSTWRTGFIRRVTTWSDTISNRTRRGTVDTGRSRYLSESQTHLRSTSPRRPTLPEARRAASVQERQATGVGRGDGLFHQGSVKNVFRDMYTGGNRLKKAEEYESGQLSSLQEGISENTFDDIGPYDQISETVSTTSSFKAISYQSLSSQNPSFSNLNEDIGPKANPETPVKNYVSSSNTPLSPLYPAETVVPMGLLPTCVGFLDNVLHGQGTAIQRQNVSAECIKELIIVADFLFAARSYEDCFSICHRLWSIVAPSSLADHASTTDGLKSSWLLVAVNVVKSAQSSEDYVAVAHIIRNMPRHDEWPEYYKTNDYCMLNALLGHIFLELGDITQAEEACLESLKHYQTLVTRQPLIQHLIATVLEEIRFAKFHRPNTEHLGQRVFQQIKRKMSVVPASPVMTADPEVFSPILSSNVDQHIQEIFTWCSEEMAQPSFVFMVSTIDVSFWSAETDEKDIAEFESCVMLCYLSEQLAQCQRPRKSLAKGAGAAMSILESFEQIQSLSGLSTIQLLTAVAKVISTENDAQTATRSQATLPDRCLQCLESLRKEMIIQSVGYTRTGQGLTSDTLFNFFEWPGQPGTHQNRFQNPKYQESVDQFLRDFAIRRLERDLSQRPRKSSTTERPSLNILNSIPPTERPTDGNG